jgi:citronellol/citronellal dehydrogenase
MYKEDLFKNKITLITGGRSGIGYGIAKMYLQHGATVIIASRKAELLAIAAKELSEFGTCDYKVCDIRKTDEIQALADFIKEKHGVLDILINNAGGQFPAPAENISDNGWAAVVNNNLNGTFYMSRIMASNFFIPQKYGNIVNIIANIWRGFPGMAHTSAARAGVDNLTKSLAQEWAEYNIRVNAIAPGIIESSGLDTYPNHIKQYFEDMRKANLMGRFGTVEDISNAIAFQTSPLSSYISGTTMYIDGMAHLSGDRMAMYRMMKKTMSEQ